MRTMILLLSWFLGTIGFAQQNPIEIGTVSWGRDLNLALQSSQKTGKSVFLLFQEVPGCKGCRDFGREVLSDPTLVPIIQDHFEPVVVYNNRGGEHERIRKQFKEPAWNYQVIRFLDDQGRDIIPRKDRVWSTPALSHRMIQVLEKKHRPVPQELLTLAGLKSGATATAAFSQYCFWTGERKLGAIEGVLVTEAGFVGHREVTKVTYDPSVISYKELKKQAESLRCASTSYESLPEKYRSAPAHDQKKQIQGTPFAKLSLTPEQATKVNAYARSNPDRAETFLTQEQRLSLRK